MTNLLTVNEVAALLNVQPRTLRLWIKNGKLSAIKLPSGDWRFREEFIENWLKMRTLKAKTF